MNFMSNARCVLLVGLLFCSACSAIAADKDLAAEWKFQTDAAGWQAVADCQLTTRDGRLVGWSEPEGYRFIDLGKKADGDK